MFWFIVKKKKLFYEPGQRYVFSSLSNSKKALNIPGHIHTKNRQKSKINKVIRSSIGATFGPGSFFRIPAVRLPH